MQIISGDEMKVNRKDKSKDKKLAGWELAREAARSELATASGRVRQLQTSLRIIEQKIREEEPWPEKAATRN
jgi:hypothetical protein